MTMWKGMKENERKWANNEEDMLNSSFSNMHGDKYTYENANNKYLHEAEITRERENMVMNAVVAFIMEMYLKETS